MGAQQLILGNAIDFITGDTIVDTVDEQARQKIAKFLIEKKGYQKKDIDTRRKIQLSVDGNTGETVVDFIIKIADIAFILIIFAPGSIVTRERLTVAAARLAEDYEIPLSIITNGVNVHIIETRSGRVIAEGFDEIPSQKEAAKKMSGLALRKISKERLEKERRILYTLDVLSKKECDSFTCCRF